MYPVKSAEAWQQSNEPSKTDMTILLSIMTIRGLNTGQTETGKQIRKEQGFIRNLYKKPENISLLILLKLQHIAEITLMIWQTWLQKNL